MEVLGIDIGGSGIKGALVNTQTGAMLTDRFRIPTPSSRKPEEMAEVVAQIAKHFDYSGPIGVGFPSIVKKGICKSKGNLHKSWVGVNIIGLFERHTGAKVFVNNDADAAATAEMAFGAGKDKKGLVMMVTIGTGLGSGAFLDGKLIPILSWDRFLIKVTIRLSCGHRRQPKKKKCSPLKDGPSDSILF